MQRHDDADQAPDVLMPQKNDEAAAARLLLVADHDPLRQHIVQLLRGSVGRLPISEAIDRREALQLAHLQPFQVIIVDLDLVHDDAVRLAADLQRLNRQAKLILLSRLGDEGLTAGDLPLAAAEIVPRQAIGAELPAAILRALGRAAT